MRTVKGAFAHLAVAIGANPEAVKALQEFESSVLERLSALEDRVTVIEEGVMSLDETFEPADPGSAALTASADTTSTAGVVEGTDTAAPIVAPGANIGTTSAATTAAVEGDGVTTAVILPADATDALRPGAGTVVTSPAPVAIAESAEPVHEEAPQLVDGTVQIPPLAVEDGETVATVQTTSATGA